MGEGRPCPVPPPQHNLEAAAQKAIDGLRGQNDDQLDWLGASAEGHDRRLSVLDEIVRVNICTGEVRTSSDAEVGPAWRILILHYLAVAVRPETMPPAVTFADLPGGRTYAGVYDQRVNKRLCFTVGRNIETLRREAERLHARWRREADLAFEVDVFPRIPVRVIWYAGDEEFQPAAVLLLAPNIESFLCIEDVVVLSERLVARLAGRPF